MDITLYMTHLNTDYINHENFLWCTKVKQFLASRHFNFKMKNIEDDDSQTELMLNGIILEDGPILQIGKIWLYGELLIFENEPNKYMILKALKIQTNQDDMDNTLDMLQRLKQSIQ
jgi:hypothetical protein